MSRTVLVTGAAGFIGHHFVEALLKTTDWHVVGLDRLDETSTLRRLGELAVVRQAGPRFRFVWHDLRAELNSYLRLQLGAVDAIVHLAASTHVDRSIQQPQSFVLDNVLGTCHALEYARTLSRLRAFVNFSTDEVFGPTHEKGFAEWDRYHSRNPYAATKAGAEELGLAYANTFRVPVITTHCMNVFGERQHPEKFLPMTVKKLLADEEIVVHTNAALEPGTRHYVHARNVAAAVIFLLEKGVPGHKYNIGGECEVSNLELVERLAAIIGRPYRSRLNPVPTSRPGHDQRYALDDIVLRTMGYAHPKTFEESLEKTVRWYVEHPEWLL